MILETERLILRKMTQEDYPALCRMLQDPLCMYAYEHAFSDEEAQQWLDRQLLRYGVDGFGSTGESDGRVCCPRERNFRPRPAAAPQ